MWNVFFLIVCIILLILFWFKLIQISLWSIVSASLIFISYNVRQAFKKRFESLTFDSEAKILTIQLVSYNGKFEFRTINQEELNLEVDLSKWKWLSPTKVYFLKKKTEIYELNLGETKLRDGDIENLIRVAQEANVPTTFL